MCVCVFVCVFVLSVAIKIDDKILQIIKHITKLKLFPETSSCRATQFQR